MARLKQGTMAAASTSCQQGLALALVALCLGAQAQEISTSGFGTIGAAVSDQSYKYQRSISDAGTFKRDSVVGIQFDAKFSAQWSATLQAKVAPAAEDDTKWAASAAWAFVSWRPSNEWLVRAGKVRSPLYLFSENLDVGQSYEFARMPTEVYSIAPTTNITGLYVTRNWTVRDADLSVDVYTGSTPRLVQRSAARDMGVKFLAVSTRLTGGVLTLRAPESTWRLGLHHADSKLLDGVATPVSLEPQLGGYYLPSSATTVRFANDVITLGADVNLPHDWRVIAEFERNVQHDIDVGANTAGGYVSVLRQWDRWTPYVTVAKLMTLGAPARLWGQLSQVVTGNPGLDMGQRILADNIPFYDQHSLILGTSYALTPQSKLKGEWMHTWVGKGSTMVDSPAGAHAVANEGINVWSFSYQFVF